MPAFVKQQPILYLYRLERQGGTYSKIADMATGETINLSYIVNERYGKHSSRRFMFRVDTLLEIC